MYALRTAAKKSGDVARQRSESYDHRAGDDEQSDGGMFQSDSSPGLKPMVCSELGILTYVQALDDTEESERNDGAPMSTPGKLQGFVPFRHSLHFF